MFYLIPPLCVAAISTYLDDGLILVLGLILKIVGVNIYMPPFSFMGYWKAIIGFIIMYKGGIFCSTAAFSLFTKFFSGSGSAKTLG